MQTRLDFSPAAADGLFHPAVEAWLRGRFGEPTPVQKQAWPVTARREHALIAAPTGSGKTLAAFLSAINELVVEGLRRDLAERVHVLYVSPLKALSNDVQKNLEAPLAGIRAELERLGCGGLNIRTAVRTGDTPQAERERMRRSPPHILVTTPESLFILLTSDAGRSMLRGVHTVIVDELHALAGNKRGAHLTLSLERLDALCERPPLRIGLSATVKPLAEMADYLIGRRGERVAIVDAGHVRERDLALELPPSPLAAVLSTEVWGEIYDRLAQLVATHRTTLIFVNQRRIAERAARHLAERIGEEHVTAHHGSLAREHRLKAEARLKAGELRALVATSSLELGIDIGEIDLVCQLGSPRGINALLQRVGRAGHAIGATPKGRLFPLSLDDLLECTALLEAIDHGELDRIRVPQAPLDVLAQQLVAEAGMQEWPLDALYARFCHAQPFRALERKAFEQVVQMLADGYTTRRGRRGAYLHYDAVNRILRPRRGARLSAVTNAGAIPDQFDYEVVLLPEGHRVGTLNEDFAFESLPGDIFQLGNSAYRVAKVETGKVFVEDAKGQPPTMPFWLGDALGRTDELSAAVSRLVQQAEALLPQGADALQRWLCESLRLSPSAAQQLTEYLAAAHGALGALPSHATVIFERFFDDVGDTHLVIHSPFGSRINKAWGLALRKRFCRTFNFELQASALEDSIVLSLGPTHSFPLETVKDFLKPGSARDVLVQALLDAPMFGTRWRWNASIALAVKRMNGGKRVPPQFQRSDAQDLLTLVFPEQLACAENLSGPREIPDHPLVQQTLADCLHETMDVDGFLALLRRIEDGSLRIVVRDTTQPSPLAHAILSARPYAFLDDGEAEERRTRAVRTQPIADLAAAGDLARLSREAIAQLREDAWPDVGSADELHDALVVHGFLTPDELAAVPGAWFDSLHQQRRIAELSIDGGPPVWIAAERLHEWQLAWPAAAVVPAIVAVSAPAADAASAWRELIRSRLELLGPVTMAALAAPLGLPAAAVELPLLQLEGEGAVMRGGYTAPGAEEWCERRLLARMHRYTREQKRASVSAVPPAQFLRFLFRWHRVAGDGDGRGEGEGALLDAIAQLEGFAAPAAAWEEELLPARLSSHSPLLLDRLCASGRIVWTRRRESRTDEAPRRAAGRTGPIRTTPIVFCPRDALVHWQGGATPEPAQPVLSGRGARLLDALRALGASFFSDLVQDTGLLRTEVEQGLGELVAAGLVSCDSYAGLRALVMPAEKRDRIRRRFGRADSTFDDAGRWSLRRAPRPRTDPVASLADPSVEHIARTLLRRYGVVFRKLLEREDGLPPWRELLYVYRRLEARDEVRGGRFVSGFSGEQYALPEVAAALPHLPPPRGPERIAISATDPLNLVGILTPGAKVARWPGNCIVYEAGVPVAVHAGGKTRYLAALAPKDEWEVKNLLIRGQRPGALLPPPDRAQ